MLVSQVFVFTTVTAVLVEYVILFLSLWNVPYVCLYACGVVQQRVKTVLNRYKTSTVLVFLKVTMVTAHPPAVKVAVHSHACNEQYKLA